MNKAKVKRKAVVIKEECVACGSCIKACPLEAITIYKGMYAEVDEDICIGCRKCAITCPATSIKMEERI